MEDLAIILGESYKIAKPGNIDSIHAYIVCRTPEYEGVVYSNLTSSIKLIKEAKTEELVNKLYGDSDTIDLHKASFHIFLFGELIHTVEKYKHLAYDYAMIQAGMITQNIHITCEDEDLKKCSLGCYSKEEALNQFLKGDDKYICLTSIIIGK